MPPSLPSISRRTALAAAPLGLLMACEWGPEERADRPGDPAPSDGDDTAHATQALELITSVAGLVAGVAARHRGLATPLADLTALHVAHAGLLQGAAGSAASATPPPVPPGSRRALALVVREERRLQEALGELAGTVESGPFARALASMAAGIAQHLAALPKNAGQGSA